MLKIARTNVNVLILGETGTGKELVARAIHESSPRRHRAFLPVDCASLHPTLLESELFGHEKGAFTGADKARYGLFEAANRGTIFLDEIGELDVSTQSKLFRVLQEGRIRQIGGRKDTLIDVRVIAATNRDLEKGLRDGTFREELYFRLNVVALSLPSLRERQEDIPMLTDHFFRLFKASHGCDQLKEVDSSFMRALLEYDWPGNIRELMNVVERSVVLSDGPQLTRADFGDYVKRQKRIERIVEEDVADDLEDYVLAKEEVLDSFDREYFGRLLSLYQGNLSLAARKSGIGRKTLYNKLKRIGIAPFDAAHHE
jgi:DNA-binding NtrC family response regulator